MGLFLFIWHGDTWKQTLTRLVMAKLLLSIGRLDVKQYQTKLKIAIFGQYRQCKIRIWHYMHDKFVENIYWNVEILSSQFYIYMQFNFKNYTIYIQVKIVLNKIVLSHYSNKYVTHAHWFRGHSVYFVIMLTFLLLLVLWRGVCF